MWFRKSGFWLAPLRTKHDFTKKNRLYQKELSLPGTSDGLEAIERLDPGTFSFYIDFRAESLPPNENNKKHFLTVNTKE